MDKLVFLCAQMGRLKQSIRYVDVILLREENQFCGQTRYISILKPVLWTGIEKINIRTLSPRRITMIGTKVKTSNIYVDDVIWMQIDDFLSFSTFQNI